MNEQEYIDFYIEYTLNYKSMLVFSKALGLPLRDVWKMIDWGEHYYRKSLRDESRLSQAQYTALQGIR